MPDQEQEELYNSLQQDWGLTTAGKLSEEEILRLLTERVIYYLEREAEPFFQLMYRLDISERKMEQAFSEPDPPRSLAMLIYERQLEKIKSREQFKPGINEDSELSW